MGDFCGGIAQTWGFHGIVRPPTPVQRDPAEIQTPGEGCCPNRRRIEQAPAGGLPHEEVPTVCVGAGHRTVGIIILNSIKDTMGHTPLPCGASDSGIVANSPQGEIVEGPAAMLVRRLCC